MKRIILTAALAALATSVFAQNSSQEQPGKLSLKQAFEILDRENPELLAARLLALESEARAAALRSTMGPQLTVSVGQQYQTSNLEGIGLFFPGAGPRIGPYRVFDARPKLTQTVLDMSLWSNVRAAKLRAKAESANAEAAAEKLRLAVVELYVQALQADSRQRAALARVENAQAISSQAQDREHAGTGNKLDIARSAEQLERERSTAAVAERDRDSSVLVLLRTLGLETTRLPALTSIGAEPVTAENAAAQPTLESALSQRAEIRAQALLKSSYEQDRQAAARARWPKITAQGDYGVVGRDPAHNLSTYTIGAGLTVPVWTNGRISNEVKAAELRLKRQEQEERQVRLAVSRDLAKANIELDSAHRIAGLTQKIVEAARLSLELARLRYGSGLTTQLDVSTAQASFAQAEEDEIRARYDSILASARIAGAAGTLREFGSNR